MPATREQLIEANRKAVKSPNHGKHGKRKLTLLKERALAKVQEEFEEELKAKLPISEMLDVHSELLRKRQVFVKKQFNHETGEYEQEVEILDTPETLAASKALDMGYQLYGKLKGKESESPKPSVQIDKQLIITINKIYGGSEPGSQ